MMGAFVNDRRADLFGPRRLWLDEQGVEGELRELAFRCWQGMDGDYLAHLQDLVSEGR